MTRIAVITGTYLPERCAVADYTAHLCAALSECCIESVVLTTYYAAEAAYDPMAMGVVHGWRLADLLPLVQAVHATKAEILHIQYAAANYGFERTIRLLPLFLRATGWRSPIITTVHDYGWRESQSQNLPPRLLQGLKRWGQRGWWDKKKGFLPLSDAVITTSADTQTAIQKQLPKLTPDVFSIPIAANIEVAPIDRIMARQLLRENCSWAENAVVIVFFGFLHPDKGLSILLSAFKQVLATQPQARLLVVGGVESLAFSNEAAQKYWVGLQALIAELNLFQLVHLTGYVSAETVSQYLAGTDIGVLPFKQGLTLKSSSLLAMLSHGLPVIATEQINALPDGHPVRLVPPGDINALATRLLELLNNPVKRIQLGADGRAFSRNFNWQSIAKSHLDVYRNLARKPTLR